MRDAATPFLAATPLTTSRVARALDCSEGTVRNMVVRGELPCTRTESGVRLFDPDVIERIAAERTARRAEGKSLGAEAVLVP